MTTEEIMRIVKALEIQARADGCQGCAFLDKEDWEMPCAECRRCCKDYWRAKE